MAYTTTAGEEVGRSEANELANLELQTAFDDLTAKGLHKKAYDLIQRGSIEAPVQVASAAPVNGLLSSLGLNSNDSRAIQGLLSQFRRAEEERRFADAGHQDHEDGGDGGYDPETPAGFGKGGFENWTFAERAKRQQQILGGQAFANTALGKLLENYPSVFNTARKLGESTGLLQTDDDLLADLKAFDNRNWSREEGKGDVTQGGIWGGSVQELEGLDKDQLAEVLGGAGGYEADTVNWTAGREIDETDRRLL